LQPLKNPFYTFLSSSHLLTPFHPTTTSINKYPSPPHFPQPLSILNEPSQRRKESPEHAEKRGVGGF
ncbi:hypothetical protein BGX38DRAFT_1332090, partial [Terfezia claveryi]